MTKKQVSNIIWHIENNREVLGDTATLNDVLNSLKNVLHEMIIGED